MVLMRRLVYFEVGRSVVYFGLNFRDVEGVIKLMVIRSD